MDGGDAASDTASTGSAASGVSGVSGASGSVADTTGGVTGTCVRPSLTPYLMLECRF
jgi:hypothetical protein